MTFRTFDTSHAFADAGASFMTDVVKDKRDDRVYLALSGGRTPQPIYEMFSHSMRDVSRIHVYQVDERYVPSGHPDLNACMIYKYLVARHEGMWGDVCFFDTDAPLKQALLVYRHQLSRVPDLRFDLMVLGVGQDGHIASLFPYASALRDIVSTVLHTTTAHHFVHDRLTVAPAVIMQARRILVVLQGDEKESVFEELQSPSIPVHAFPAHMLQSHPDVTVHYVM